ncbi:MAG: hypothetical protein QG566_352 [Patescibacteria group bacterium]|nr:hypothetical protein [Patescibacteria group bacterium]
MLKNKNKILGIIFSLIVSFAFANSVFAADVFYNYAKGIGGTGSDLGASILSDSGGSVYVISTFTGTADFDPGEGTANLTSQAATGVALVKLDLSGNFVWAKQIGGNRTGELDNDIALDSSGNIYITGGFTGTADFDPGVGTTNLTALGSAGGANDIYISKLDSNGDLIWVKQIGCNGNDLAAWQGCDDFGSSIFVSGSNLYIGGSFGGTVDFDPGAGTTNLTRDGGGTGVDIFVAKYDLSANLVWAKNMGGSGWGDWVYDMTVDSSGNVYTTGGYSGTGASADLDPGVGTTTVTGAGGLDIFISKLDSSGNFVYGKGIAGAQWDFSYGIAVDTNGNAYITGLFLNSTLDFDPGAGTANLTSNGAAEDIYILKLDSSGDFVWVKQIGGTGYDIARSLKLDSSNNIYITGVFNDTTDFDPGAGTYELTSIGANDAYIAKFDSDGAFIYAKGFGGTGNDLAEKSYINSTNGYVYLVGYFNATADFDPSSSTANLTSAGGNDIFISVLAPDTTAPTITSVSTSNITNTSVTITWTTNEESSTLVEYSLDSSYSTSTAETDTSTRVTSHTVSLSNLNPCTSYQYRVKSNDSSSNLATDTNHTLEMPGCQNSSTSAGSRAYNLFAMGKTQEAKDIVTQFPNALNEIKDEDVKKELTTDTSPSSSNPSSTITFTKTIKKGTVSPLVSTIQKVIGVNPDGKFGPITLKAVKEFQTKNNLKSDGIVGPKTWAVVSGLVK